MSSDKLNPARKEKIGHFSLRKASLSAPFWPTRGFYGGLLSKTERKPEDLPGAL